MDSLDFSYAEHVDWFCLQYGAFLVASRLSLNHNRGGADQISTRMAEKVRAEKATDPISLGAHVTKIAFVQSQVEVSVVGEASPRRYDHVISTVPFGCLRTIDTSECPFSWELQTAIRTLHYDTSVKVGIQFKTRWWEQDGPKLNHRGGLSNTDLPVRTIVYPSYGIGGDTGATMIGTYTWAQDAARFGGLINGKNSVGEGVLLEQILGDLARVHDLDVAFLREQVVDYKAFDWYAHPYANGIVLPQRCPIC
jgi:monoamine oxidase